MESPRSTDMQNTPTSAPAPAASELCGPQTSTVSNLSSGEKHPTPGVKVSRLADTVTELDSNGKAGLTRRKPSLTTKVAGTVGEPDTHGLLDRDRLLKDAHITPAAQAQAVKKAWDKKLQLLEATTIKHFAHEGKVMDERVLSDNRTQLDAAETLDRMLGVVAPKAEQKVQVTYRLELPDWSRPDNAKEVPTIVEIEANSVEDVTPATHERVAQ